MMLRVESTKQDSHTIVQIAGKLQGQHIPDVEKQCAAAGEAGSRVTLDLSGLRSADGEAVRWLDHLMARGARIVGESPYIRLLLERAQEGSDQ